MTSLIVRVWPLHTIIKPSAKHKFMNLKDIHKGWYLNNECLSVEPQSQSSRQLSVISTKITGDIGYPCLQPIKAKVLDKYPRQAQR